MCSKPRFSCSLFRSVILDKQQRPVPLPDDCAEVLVRQSLAEVRLVGLEKVVRPDRTTHYYCSYRNTVIFIPFRMILHGWFNSTRQAILQGYLDLWKWKENPVFTQLCDINFSTSDIRQDETRLRPKLSEGTATVRCQQTM